VIIMEIAGDLGQIEVAGGVTADGINSDAIHVRGDTASLDSLSVHAAHGQAIIRTA
jgi:hypothetical protein